MDDNQFWLGLITLIVANLGAIVAAWRSLLNRIGENTAITKESVKVTEEKVDAALSSTVKKVDDTIEMAKFEAVNANVQLAREHKEEIKELKQQVNGRMDMLIIEARRSAFKEGWIARDQNKPMKPPEGV